MIREPCQHGAWSRGMKRGLRVDQRRAGSLAVEAQLLQADFVMEVAPAHGQFQLVIEEAACEFAEYRFRFGSVGRRNRSRYQVAGGLVGIAPRFAGKPPPRQG